MKDEWIEGSLFAQDVVLAFLSASVGVNLDELQQVATTFVTKPSGEIDLKDTHDQLVRRTASMRIKLMLDIARDMRKMLEDEAAKREQRLQ